MKVRIVRFAMLTAAKIAAAAAQNSSGDIRRFGGFTDAPVTYFDVSCDEGDRGACVRLGIIIGENRERRAAWRRDHPELFFYER